MNNSYFIVLRERCGKITISCPPLDFNFKCYNMAYYRVCFPNAWAATLLSNASGIKPLMYVRFPMRYPKIVDPKEVKQYYTVNYAFNITRKRTTTLNKLLTEIDLYPEHYNCKLIIL